MIHHRINKTASCTRKRTASTAKAWPTLMFKSAVSNYQCVVLPGTYNNDMLSKSSPHSNHPLSCLQAGQPVQSAVNMLRAGAPVSYPPHIMNLDGSYMPGNAPAPQSMQGGSAPQPAAHASGPHAQAAGDARSAKLRPRRCLEAL